MVHNVQALEGGSVTVEITARLSELDASEEVVSMTDAAGDLPAYPSGSNTLMYRIQIPREISGSFLFSI